MVLHQYYFNKAEIKYISSVVPALLVVGWHIVVQHKKELVDIYDQPMCNYFRKMGKILIFYMHFFSSLFN